MEISRIDIYAETTMETNSSDPDHLYSHYTRERIRLTVARSRVVTTASESRRFPANGRPFGWEGSSQRPTDRTPNLTSLIQMGARPYAPQIGRFLAVDPVEGGATTNPYGYVNDPVNFEDLTGSFGMPKFVKKAIRVVATVAVVTVTVAAIGACGVSIVCGAVVGAAGGAAAYATQKAGTDEFSWRDMGVSAAFGAVGGAAGARWGAPALASATQGKKIAMGDYRAKLHYDSKVHPFRSVGNRPHWQVNVWQKGIKDSDRVARLPMLGRRGPM